MCVDLASGLDSVHDLGYRCRSGPRGTSCEQACTPTCRHGSIEVWRYGGVHAYVWVWRPGEPGCGGTGMRIGRYGRMEA